METNHKSTLNLLAEITTVKRYFFDRCNSLTLNGTQYCEWNYNGLGLDYQLLAGPSFMAVFSFFGVVAGIAADRFNRQDNFLLKENNLTMDKFMTCEKMIFSFH